MVGTEVVSIDEAGRTGNTKIQRAGGLGGWGPHGRVSAGSDMARFAA